MTACTVDGNYAADGAGFYQSSVTDESISKLERCTFSNNVITNNSFSAIHGAVEVYKRGTCTMTNCEVRNTNTHAVVSENLSGLSHISLINCTLAHNHASLHVRKTNLDISNSIIWNDDIIAVGQHAFNDDNLINISNSVVKGGSSSVFNGVKIIEADPQFLSEDDLRPSSGSVCIDNGDPSIANSTDILGNARPLPEGTNPDIGVYEVDQETTRTTDLSLEKLEVSVYPNPSNGQINLSEKVNSLSLHSMTGELLLQKSNTDYLATDKLAPGIYLLNLEKGVRTKQEAVILIH